MSYNRYSRYTPRKRSLLDRLIDNLDVVIGCFVALVFVAIAVAVPVLTSNWVNTKNSYANCQILDKGSVSKGKSGHEYRVYTSCGIFTTKDELWLGHFNAADLYADLETGQTYNFHTVGWRNGFFSTFPNIVKVIR